MHTRRWKLLRLNEMLRRHVLQWEVQVWRLLSPLGRILQLHVAQRLLLGHVRP
jgi:hypothetical protein